MIQLIQEQKPDDYVSFEKLLQFEAGRYESALEIDIDKKNAAACGWMITLESEEKV